MPSYLNAVLLLVGTLLQPGMAGYTLSKNFTGQEAFFQNFAFFSGPDPTDGFVQYVNQSQASENNLAGTIPTSMSANSVYLGVDSTNQASQGRMATRVLSHDVFNQSLFIADISHAPEGCGTWPAFWLLGANNQWPKAGEIDIMEGVNQQSGNQMTLHTDSGCSISSSSSSSSSFTGQVMTSNCDVNAQGQPMNAGCAVSDSSNNASYGTGFNAQNGGVYATEVTAGAIKIWFFGRTSIPTDISSGSPDPTTWGNPVANFQGNCNVTQHFQDLQIIFDTTFCGQWAGQVWNTSSCASLAPTCEEYVEKNPSAFKDAYWAIDGLTVYSTDGQVASNSTQPVQKRAGGAVLPWF